jgi:D-glycerate 3-kinase
VTEFTQDWSDVTAPLPDWQQDFLSRHDLPAAYLQTALNWFAPVGQLLLEHQNGAGGPLLVGVNGSQGSGKSTLCAFLCDWLGAEHAVGAVSLSLDDFYLTRRERQQLAADVHPLLATRGVPGTHDMDLLQATLRSLLAGQPTSVPRFDKAVDDRVPNDQWETVDGGVGLVLLEGWCLGVVAQPEAALLLPVNELESREDPTGGWRQYVNAVLQERFPPIYSLVQEWVMLRAPSFDCVYRWRLEQESRLAERRSGSAIMSADEVRRFIQHYQRLTEHCLVSLPRHVNHLFTLDDERRIVSYMAAPGVRP